MIKIKGDFAKWGDWVDATVNHRHREATARALNDVAFKARKAVQAEMKAVFKAPNNFTMNSILFTKADPTKREKDQSVLVYVRDDYTNRSISPRKYLLAEELGGTRHNKRSEVAFQNAGLIMAGQQTGPADGKNFSGQEMGRIISRVKASGQQGYLANATEKTTRRLKAQKAIISKQTGTDYFVARSKLDEGFMGIFQFTGTGKGRERIKAVIWFTLKRPTYAPIFHFGLIVQRTAAENFARQLQRNLAYLAREGLKKD